MNIKSTRARFFHSQFQVYINIIHIYITLDIKLYKNYCSSVILVSCIYSYFYILFSYIFIYFSKIIFITDKINNTF